MNFKDLLLRLNEESRTQADSFRTTGEALKKERAVSGAPDKKAKDAARKRAERSKQIPRSRKTKEELIKEVVPVKTQAGNVQLIFRDSFDKGRHTKLMKGESLSFEEAKSFTKDPKFEQTGASKLLFGELKAKEEPKEKTPEQGAATGPGKEVEQEAEEQQEKGAPEGKQAKKATKEDIFNMLGQMSPEQLAQVPFEVRQEYFMQTRKPTSSNAFDSMTFEKLSNLFGINSLTTTPYNQQVINALVLLAKLKAGASEQEIQSYAALSPTAFDFTKIAFAQARKILSQMGEQCIQNLVSTVENSTSGITNEGNVDMECGGYKFKVAAGGEFLLTTDKFDQKSKTYRGLINAAMAETLQNPSIAKDPKVKAFADSVNQAGSKFSNVLVNQQSFAMIKKNPELLAQMQQIEVQDSSGQSLGMLVDEKGNLNNKASFEKYKEEISKPSVSLFKNNPKNPSEFVDNFVQSILKMYYRGDNLKDPEAAPNHLVTQNGIFKLSDDYIEEIARTATVAVKTIKKEPGTENILKGNKPSELFNRFVTVVEAKEQPRKNKFSIEDLLIRKETLDPVQMALAQASQNMDFDINVSLLPGFTPKDLNTIQYNYVKIGKKTVKIPVEKTELITLEMQEHVAILTNQLLIESLTNNFVLEKLIKSGLLTSEEAESIVTPGILAEENYIKVVYKNLLERVQENPNILVYILNAYNSDLYEKYVRDYKMEYRNYHGKPKQRKERAARTKAREQLIKKGRVKKGDGKDVDHKVPLRNGGSKGLNNVRVRDRSKNRSDNGHKKGEKQNKDWE